MLWAARGFFTGAVWALRQRTLDMNVLVAVAIGVSWVYSAAVTAGLSGDVFFDAGAPEPRLGDTTTVIQLRLAHNQLVCPIERQ